MPEEFAPAKVNLYLHVTGRRPDGYHLLDSLAVFPAVGDHLDAEPASSLTLELAGPFAASLSADDNLVLRAAKLLQKAASIDAGARLTLDKRLPVASGIGGGSADAAAAIRLLVRLWHVSLPPATLAAMALELGADVPVCLYGEPARMGGIGELIGTAPVLPPAGIVLVNPGVPVATAGVFRARAGSYSEPATLPPSWPDAAALAQTLSALGNDLEAPALSLCPAIGDALAWLRARNGALLARMSGSGATCYGLFPDESAAAAAAADPPPGWWSWGGALSSAYPSQRNGAN